MEINKYSYCCCQFFKKPNFWKKYMNNRWIKKDIEISNNIMKGNRNLQKHLNKQRIEIICFGCLWKKHPDILTKWKIVNRDNKLTTDLTDKMIRPDLILKYKNNIIHVEINENNYRGYNEIDEKERENIIRKTFKDFNYELIDFVPDLTKKYESALYLTEIVYNSCKEVEYYNDKTL